MNELSVHPIACLRDNYCYLIRCQDSGDTALVDPSEGGPVLAELERRAIEPVAILNTHHHPDHVGGNESLLRRWPHLRVYGHTSDRGRIPGQTDFLEDLQTLSIGEQRADILHIPGHTTGAIAFCFAADIFTGDTLFSAGCGRLFEGTAAQMHESLQRISRLPSSLKVWSGHEYTVANLTFAQAAEPQNEAVQRAHARAVEQRANHQSTMPSSLGEERETNPFMRAQSVEKFAELRLWKDQF
jgi:hydroxyacylglutathione hydrolase